MYPINHKLGQKIQSDASGISVDRAFIAHIIISAEDAAAAGTSGILALTNLGAEAKSINQGITNPKVPRNIQIVGNVAGIDGKVTVTGTNYKGAVIAEDLNANGTTPVIGTKAFKTITKIDLPIQDHVPAAQTETIKVTAGVSAAGDITVAITAAALGADSPVSVSVTLAAEDNTAAEVAAKIVEALNADVKVNAQFTASAVDADITLTAKFPAANDATLAIAVTAGSTGVTVGASSNGTTGVPYDKISVGWGDKFGLPYCLSHNTVLKTYFNLSEEGTPPTVTVDSDEIEKNTFDLNSTPDGLKQIDLYLLI